MIIANNDGRGLLCSEKRHFSIDTAHATTKVSGHSVNSQARVNDGGAEAK